VHQDSGLPALAHRGSTAIVTLRRPSQANRLQQEDVAHLHALWSSLRDDHTVRAVVLTATGRHFSAGYDLTSILHTVDLDPSAEVVDNAFERMVDQLESLPQVTVCALNGGVYGGATDLALACDFRYGVATCEMFMPAARLGLQYYLNGLRRYATRLGLDNAKRLFLLAEKLDAEAMLEVGYLHQIVPADQLLQQALATAETAARMAPLASRGMKAALNAIAGDRVDERATRLSETRTLRSRDIREGVTAWREKRDPLFEGT